MQDVFNEIVLLLLAILMGFLVGSLLSLTEVIFTSLYLSLDAFL